jgi:hypothetical protein
MKIENQKKFEWEGDWHPCEEMEKEYNENQKFEKEFLITIFVVLHIVIFTIAFFTS